MGAYRPQAIRRHYIPKPGSAGEASAGDTDGARPGGSDGVAAWCWNRSSSGTSRRTATASAPDGAARMRCGGSTSCSKDGSGIRRRCRSEELLRHDPARPPAGRGRPEGGGREDAEAAGAVPAAGHPGRAGRVDAGARHAARRGDLSPLLSNIYLDPLDHLMASAGLRDGALCRRLRGAVPQSKRKRPEPWRRLRQWTAASRPDAASRQDAHRRRTDAGLRLPGLSVRATADAGRATRAWGSSRTRSAPRRDGPQGTACGRSSTDLNPMLRGWFEYFKHSYRTTFSDLDGWIRVRLRSMLRTPTRRHGASAGATTIIAGPTPSLPSTGCSACNEPMRWPVSPLAR